MPPGVYIATPGINRISEWWMTGQHRIPAWCHGPRGHLDFERGVILREMEEVEKTTEEAQQRSALAASCSCPRSWSQVIFDRLHLTAFHDSP